jgi:hypothetical protein
MALPSWLLYLLALPSWLLYLLALPSWLLYLLALPSWPIFLYLPSHGHITLPSFKTFSVFTVSQVVV